MSTNDSKSAVVMSVDLWVVRYIHYFTLFCAYKYQTPFYAAIKSIVRIILNKV
jgi:hypothetical protein